MNAIPLAWQVLLEHAMLRCAGAGFGRVEWTDGTFHFEAFPGCEDAAADYIQRELITRGPTS